MATFGPNGLEIDTQAEILAQLLSKLQAAFGSSANPTPTNIWGQISNIEAEQLAAQEIVLLELYRSRNPNEAVGTNLDGLSALTGTERRGPTASTILGDIEFGGPGVVNNGDLILDVVKNTQWQAINGPYTDTGGPYPEQVPATFESVIDGPVTALANTLWNVVTVSPNFDAFTNPLEDATPGRLEESDAGLRRRRNIEVYSQGIGSKEVIAARVSAVATANGEVSAVRVYDNPTENPFDSDGIPWKAANVVVETIPSPPSLALQQDIADAIFLGTGAGVEPWGTDFVGLFVNPLEGNPLEVKFDLVDEVDIWIDVVVQTALLTASGNLPVIPTDPQQMADLIREYIIEQANGVAQLNVIGKDVQYSAFIGFIDTLITTEQLRGVDIFNVGVDDTNLGPFEEFFIIGIREKANFDTGRVLVNIDGVDY